MIVYRCVKRFMCSPLGRALPIGSHVARYENATRIVIDDAPRSDQDVFNILADGYVYDEPTKVTWFYGVEPPPRGTSNSGFFVRVSTAPEDNYGNVWTGFPSNSKMQLGTDGTVYLQNVTTSLWHPLRVNGPDGAVFLELGQNGVVTPP